MRETSCRMLCEYGNISRFAANHIAVTERMTRVNRVFPYQRRNTMAITIGATAEPTRKYGLSLSRKLPTGINGV